MSTMITLPSGSTLSADTWQWILEEGTWQGLLDESMYSMKDLLFVEREIGKQS